MFIFSFLGCKVVIASRKEDRLLQAVSEMQNVLKEKLPDVSSIVCNIRKEDEVYVSLIIFYS